MWTDALIALGFATFMLVVVIPILGLVLLTVLDICFRIDLNLSRLVWLPVVLMVPIGGLLAYWLVRPKDYDPLHETRETGTYSRPMTFAVTRQTAMAAAAPTPIRAREEATQIPTAMDVSERRAA